MSVELGTRVTPRNSTRGPGSVVSLDEAWQFDAERLDRVEGDPNRFVWVRHDDGQIGAWYPESLEVQP